MKSFSEYNVMCDHIDSDPGKWKIISHVLWKCRQNPLINFDQQQFVIPIAMKYITNAHYKCVMSYYQ